MRWLRNLFVRWFFSDWPLVHHTVADDCTDEVTKKDWSDTLGDVIDTGSEFKLFFERERLHIQAPLMKLGEPNANGDTFSPQAAESIKEAEHTFLMMPPENRLRNVIGEVEAITIDEKGTVHVLASLLDTPRGEAILTAIEAVSRSGPYRSSIPCKIGFSLGGVIKSQREDGVIDDIEVTHVNLIFEGEPVQRAEG